MEYSGYIQKSQHGGITLYQADCMKMLPQIPDKYYQLCICDPPYGIGDTTTSAGNKLRSTKHKRVTWNKEIPSAEYFEQLYRVSENQIIWGCNYFYPFIKVSGRIVHYKKPFQDLSKKKIRFCPCDLASQSFDKRIEFFEYNWYGNTQGGKPNFNNTGPDARIHPTQKPICLYEWLLKNYAKPGDRILDTHCGSGSILIACDILGFSIDAYEIDADYYQAAKERLERHQRQEVLPL